MGGGCCGGNDAGLVTVTRAVGGMLRNEGDWVEEARVRALVAAAPEGVVVEADANGVELAVVDVPALPAALVGPEELRLDAAACSLASGAAVPPARALGVT